MWCRAVHENLMIGLFWRSHPVRFPLARQKDCHRVLCIISETHWQLLEG